VPQRIYPTVEEVIETQRLLIAETGGTYGLRDRALLESAVFRPRSGYYRNILEEAAALMESLSNNQAFVDGNKRTAWAVADSFLRANGYVVDVDPTQAYAFIRNALRKHEFRFPLILDWINSHTRPLDPEKD
jgi:death on curing protein